MATTTLTPAASAYRSSSVRVADDDRPQEDRDPVPDQLVLLLLLRRASWRSSSGPSSPSRGSSSSNDQTYNELFSMHATIMIFLFIIPILAGFGNYVVPLQIGAPDMAFPRINALSLWMLPLGGILLLLGFVTGGTAAAGWTSYAPLSEDHALAATGTGQDLWIVGAGPDRDELDPGRHQLPGHDLQDAGAGDDPVPDADHGLDRAGHLGPGADGDAGHHQRPDHAVHRPQLRRVVLRPARRRRRDPLPEHLLVLLAPGGLRDDPAGDGHGQRDPAGLLPQAAVRLQGVRLRDGGDRRPGLLRVGPPHVHDRRGLPAVLQHHDLPDRGPDRGQDVQLDLHACGAGS